jgi:dienelactone hydrolase
VSARAGARLGMAVALGLAAGRLAPAPASAEDDMTVRRQALEPYFRMVRPSGIGPFPALLFVSGCSGFLPKLAPQFYTETAERWRGRGYVVAFVDYLAARGQTDCRNLPSHTLVEIGKDVLAAAAYLPTLSRIDPARIGGLGWSLGGGGLLAALGQLDAGGKIPLRVAVAYYPVCRTLPVWRARVPVLSLLAGKDETAPPAICREIFAQLAPGMPLETRVFPEAGHAFNVPGLPGYDAAAAAAAEHDVEQFIGR